MAHAWALKKAEHWWRQRSPDPPPENAYEAVGLAEAGALAPTNRITVRSTVGEKFERIIGYQLGDKPEPGIAWREVDFEDIPF